MLATPTDEPTEADLTDARAIYEPKYDGIRALVEIDPGVGTRGRSKGARTAKSVDASTPVVRLWSRLGNSKNAQFPELVDALARLARKLGVPLLLDGEIVALDDGGAPAGFQALQARIHLTRSAEIREAASAHPAAFIAFDLLRDDREDLRPLAFTERRDRLERRLGKRRAGRVRLSPVTPGDGRRLYLRAGDAGWEGLIAKIARSPYESGRRSRAWRKIQIPRRQEFVVGGWSEPRGSRHDFGALLVGVHDAGRLRYAGHVGSGFTETELARVSARLRDLEVADCPFVTPPHSGEPAHWVRPELVAEVKFTEWTTEGNLRHPTYLGLHDDRDPSTVVRETPARVTTPGGRSPVATVEPRRAPPRAPAAPRRARRRPNARPRSSIPGPELQAVLAQLQELEDLGRDGPVLLPDGHRLRVTNLRKVFWPDSGITKGELLRFYARISPLILPVVADRIMVMKRFPNGVRRAAFYQQRSRDRAPDGVRVEALPDGVDPIAEPGAERLIGGGLTTLLYMAQIAAISQDPWFSRVQSPLEADYAALDLDPMDGVPFEQVLDVARWIRDELDVLGSPGFPKTSGASGLHIYVPLPPRTAYGSGMLFCQIVATIVATRHPKAATVTRAVKARGRTVYIDYLQNIMGKPLATAYSARASEFAGVSTPLTWREVDEGVDPRDFTIRSIDDRLASVGDLWENLRISKAADLRAALRYGEKLR